MKKESKLKFFLWFLGPIVLFLFFGLVTGQFSPKSYQKIIEAQELILQQKYDKALITYEKILQKKIPSEIKTRILIQQSELLSIFLNRPKEAVESILQAKQEAPEDLPLQLSLDSKLAELYFGVLKDYQKSYVIYKKMSQIIPKIENYDFYRYRSLLSLFFQSKYSLAKEETEKVLKESPDFSFYKECILLLGKIFFYQEDYEQSLKYFAQFLSFEGIAQRQLAETKFLMANAYESLGKLKNAYKFYESTLKHYPNIEVVKQRLNSVFQRKTKQIRY